MTLSPGEQPSISAVKADWYPNPHNPAQLRYWDGVAWTENYAPAPAATQPYQEPAYQQRPTYQQPPYQQAPQQQFQSSGPMTSAGMNVHRDVIYTRQQQGHSLTLWIILSVFLFFPWIGVIYYSASPNHYWHA